LASFFEQNALPKLRDLTLGAKIPVNNQTLNALRMYCPRVRRLWVTGCLSSKPAWLPGLCEVYPALTHLFLDLRHWPQWSPEGRRFLDSFSTLLSSKNSSIVTLERLLVASFAPLPASTVCAVLRCCPRLQELGLDQGQSPSLPKATDPLWEKPPPLRRLSLRRFDFDFYALPRLLTLLQGTLHTLSLDKAVTPLPESQAGLPTLPGLRKLSLTHCDLTLGELQVTSACVYTQILSQARIVVLCTTHLPPATLFPHALTFPH
jgi:hypothetical protein